MNSLTITAQMFRENFGAVNCTVVAKFEDDYPDGLDISPLWGTNEQANALWQKILSGWLKQYVGWAIAVGIVPARIRANLSWANLSWANLSWANLSWANLSGANLSGANLYGANLSWANLSWANLSWANLPGANLSWANLSWADLSWANLYGANLSRANLYGANLSRANLCGANLYGAGLDDIIANQYTRWPEDFTVPNTVKEKAP